MEQVGSSNNSEGLKPIVIVGTHADLLSKEQRDTVMEEVEKLFPSQTSKIQARSQICGHFTITLAPGKLESLPTLKAALLEIALSHPKIGVGKVQVPQALVILQKEIDAIKHNTPFLLWENYVNLFSILKKLTFILNYFYDYF